MHVHVPLKGAKPGLGVLGQFLFLDYNTVLKYLLLVNGTSIITKSFNKTILVDYYTRYSDMQRCCDQSCPHSLAHISSQVFPFNFYGPEP